MSAENAEGLVAVVTTVETGDPVGEGVWWTEEWTDVVSKWTSVVINLT